LDEHTLADLVEKPRAIAQAPLAVASASPDVVSSTGRDRPRDDLTSPSRGRIGQPVSDDCCARQAEIGNSSHSGARSQPDIQSFAGSSAQKIASTIVTDSSHR
jgi:hypothetical protein